MEDIDFGWGDAFPKGEGHTSVTYLMHCSGFWDAKKGNMRAAREVVDKCAKPGRFRILAEKYRTATLLPVQRYNVLPLALAEAAGMPVDRGVYRTDNTNRKELSSMQRLIHRPQFQGSIVLGASYVLVDDIVTQGGTANALRGFVIAKGGRVQAVEALAYLGENNIAPKPGTILLIHKKFGPQLSAILEEYGIGKLEYLTESQILYLLRFSSLQNIEKAILETLKKIPLSG